MSAAQSAQVADALSGFEDLPQIADLMVLLSPQETKAGAAPTVRDGTCHEPG